MIGTEVFTAGLPSAAQRTPADEFIHMDARKVPFADEFDLVGAFDVLEHIQSTLQNPHTPHEHWHCRVIADGQFPRNVFHWGLISGGFEA